MEITHSYYGSYDLCKKPKHGVDQFMMTEYMRDFLDKHTQGIVRDLNKITKDAKNEHKKSLATTKKDIADLKQAMGEINKMLTALIELNELIKPMRPAKPTKKPKPKIEEDDEDDF